MSSSFAEINTSLADEGRYFVIKLCNNINVIKMRYSLRSNILVQSLTRSRGSLLAGSGSPSVALRRLPNGEHLYQREP